MIILTHFRVAGEVDPKFKTKMRDLTQRMQRAVKSVVKDSAELVKGQVQAATPVDTGFMQANVRIKYTDKELSYLVGWFRDDFIGETNPDGKVITTFYPYYVVHGARGIPGNDPLSPALEGESRRLLADMKAAIENA